MRFYSFSDGERSSYGVLTDAGLIDLPEAAARRGLAFPPTLSGMIEAGPGAIEQVDKWIGDGTDAYPVRLDAVYLQPPIPHPNKNIFCVGRNYVDHVAEGYRAAGKQVALPAFPQFFTKATTAVGAPIGEFVWDAAMTQQLDYEVELAVVIGEGGRNIARKDAWSHVFGFTVLNDITARDLQRRHDQWFKGKSLDGSAPMGPCIVTLDEFEDIGSIELVARVNGETRQKACVSQMIFDIPELIAQLSAGLTLQSGDVIATGTPSGVGYAMDPPQFLQDGDVVECSIPGIGTISTRIVGAPGES